MSLPTTSTIRRPLPDKLLVYENLYRLNRCFEATLRSLERLERCGIFSSECLSEYRVRIEYTRAEANEELIDTLCSHEMEDAAHFDKLQQAWEAQHSDPDDVFLRARRREQEIKQQIGDLQSALNQKRTVSAQKVKRKGMDI
jgi:hypothetical protein